MAISAKAVIAAVVLVALAICSCSAVEVLPMRIDNPTPDGSGVVFFQLKAATADAFANFKIISLSITGSQVLKKWNADDGTCDGEQLLVNGLVPTDGKVCFWGTQGTEGESSFEYAAVDGDGVVGAPQTVVVVNYNVQNCPGIPDLGPSGFATVPASPEVSISLDGLQIHFEVTASYLRNQSAWFLDFFEFDNTNPLDSADGTGRTCSNHASSDFTGISFPQWWQSQPRATFAQALNSTTFPMYKSNAKWSIVTAGCDKVKYTATIPTVNLISNSATDCKRNGLPAPAATANGLVYTATLYAVALRPRDINDKAQGYYQVTYSYPFSFRIQQTVTDIKTTSSAFAFQVSVDNMKVTRGQGLVLSVETILSDPRSTTITPDLDNFQLTDYPHMADHGANPTLVRVSDNGHCAQAGEHLPCAILWKVTINELSVEQLGNNMDAYNRQFVGAYTLQWTAAGLPLKSQLIIDAVAANSTDLGQLDVKSKVNFFRSSGDMADTADTTGLITPTFSSGEKIWVRHSFLIDTKDVAAYVFTLQRAWVCWSPVAGFVPSINPGTGCSQDIPGVMEAALGHRFMLYDIQVGGITDVTFPAGSTQKSRVWGWSLVPPSPNSWSGGQTVHTGFGINALPLVADAQPHTYYFHLVSQVSQATLPVSKRSEESLFQFSRADGVDTSSGAGMSSITVVSEQSASPASQLSASWAAQLMVF